MFQELIENTKKDIEDWDWEKKKKELKAHYYKYRYHYAVATVLILIIVIIEEQNIPPIMIGGNDENIFAKQSKKSKDKKAGEEPKKPGEEPKKAGEEPKKPGEEPKKAGDEPNKVGNDAKDKTSGENDLIGNEKDKKKGKGSGFNISSMKGPFNNGIKNFGGGVFNMIQRIMKIIGYVFLAAFIVVIPALIYLVLVYLMFKLIVKGGIKM